MSNSSFPRFLNTSPSGKDELKSGAQNLCANAIVDYVRSSSPSKLIGLEGRWGVGKSNVVGIVSHALAESHHVFIYDAWSHQEDLTRRSFLEDLTTNLLHNIIDNKNWTDKLAKLLAKKKETSQKTIPKFSMAVLISFSAIVLTPIFAAIGRAAEQEGIRILLTSIPLIFSLICWGVAAYRFKEYREIKSFFYIYRTDKIDTTTTETISEAEPSIWQFRAWMDELSVELKKPLIIVFDNMDRLPSDKIQIVWSAIHTFFSEKQYENIWVIVPFDKAQISKAFNENSDIEQSKVVAQRNGYIAKTFSVIFSVTFPVLTDWHQLFTQKFLEAFGDTESESLVLVKSIFDRHHKLITPRDVVNFLNELVALRLIWKKRIELKYMALFILAKEAIMEDPISAIVQGQYIKPVQSFFKNDSELPDKICSLTFNIPLEDALQVTLRRETQIRIQRGNNASLGELLNYQQFHLVLDQVVTGGEWEKDSMINGLAFFETQSISSENPVLFKSLWQQLQDRQILEENDIQDLEEAHFNLLKFGDKHRLGIGFIQHLLAKIVQNRNLNGYKYFYFLKNLDDFFYANSISVNLREIVDQYFEPTIYLEYLEASGVRVLEFPVQCDYMKLEALILSYLDEDGRTIPTLRYLEGKYHFEKLVTDVESRINDESITLNNILKLFLLYEDLCSTRPLPLKITDAHVHTLLANCPPESSTYIELVAMRVGTLATATSYGGVSDIVLGLTEEEIADKVSKRIHLYAKLDSLLANSIQLPYPLIINVAKIVLVKKLIDRKIDISFILTNFNAFLQRYEMDPQIFLSYVAGFDHEIEKRLVVSNLKSVIIDATFYDTALTYKNKIANRVIEVALQYTEILNGGQVDHIFDGKSDYELMLVFYLAKHNSWNELPNHLVEGMRRSIAKIENLDIFFGERLQYLHELFRISTKKSFSTISKNLRDHFINNAEITNQEFLVLEPFLRLSGQLDQRSDDVVRAVLMRVFDDSNVETVMLENKEFYQKMIVTSGIAGEELLNKLRVKIENGAASTDLISFCKEVGAILSEYIEIVSAIYISTEEFKVDVTEAVQKKVKVYKELHFLIDNSIAGHDPHPNHPKRLVVTYNRNSEGISKIFPEREWLRLP